MDTTIAPVKSAFSSWTNWIAGVGGALTTLSTFGAQIVPFLPGQYHVYGTAALAILTALGSIWARTTSNAVLAPSVK